MKAAKERALRGVSIDIDREGNPFGFSGRHCSTQYAVCQRTLLVGYGALSGVEWLLQAVLAIVLPVPHGRFSIVGNIYDVPLIRFDFSFGRHAGICTISQERHELYPSGGCSS